MISEDIVSNLIKSYLPQITEQRLKLLSRAVVQETELAIYTITRQIVSSEREYEKASLSLTANFPPKVSSW